MNTSEANYKSCSKCNSNSNVIPIIYGRPNTSLIDQSKRGEVKLGGCIFQDKKFFCKSCEHEF